MGVRPRAMNRSPEGRRAGLWLLAERAAWGIGVICVAGWSALYIDGVTGRQRLLDSFEVLQAAAPQQADAPDQTLWSPERIAAWRSAVKDPGAIPLAILRIPRIRLEVPVLDGTDDVSLNRAVGHIADTARPGTDGNSGIAGHRDGFFRGLKDIAPGDSIQLETLLATEVYRVERIWIVDPEDVSVLDPTPARSLTLVTCYPFYFVGSAPRRFIVRAALAEDASASVRPER
jgi:sortase A